MKGKHAKKKKSYIKMMISFVLCLTLVVFLFYHFQDQDEENYQQYPLLEGQIAGVGDETLLIRLDDNRQYLVSIAGVIDSNKGLLVGNRISIRYDGVLDNDYDDIQNIKVKHYEVEMTSIANSKNATIDNELSQLVQNMTLEEKIAQMFLIRCPEEGQSEFVSSFQPGGYLMFADDFENKSQDEVIQSIRDYQNQSKINMFIAVDEEGGTVVRVSQFFRKQRFQSPRIIYSQGGYEAIVEDTKEKDQFLKEFGINLNMAPVADVSTDPQDFMYSRSFGISAEATGKYVQKVVKQMNQDKMGSCLKHFPGYGNNGDSHESVIHDTRSLELIKENDFVPFEKGIAENANMILVCHNIIDSIDSSLPASLSAGVHDILREELDYQGIIITDDLDMDAVKELDSDENNAVKAVKAGNDMLISSNPEVQYQAIYDAVKNNEISENQIDISVLRILYYKQFLNII